MAASKNIRYIPAVDHLRAYAALLVLLYHSVLKLVPLQYKNWPKAGNPLSAFIYEGHTGVSLFLVLSGFIFTYGSAGREIEYRTFLRNRLLRIYPLLIALLAVGVSVYASQLNPTQVIETLLPVQNLRAANPTTYLGPYTALLWTITVEFQFYLIFPFLHRQLVRRGILGLLPLMLFLLLARWSALLIGDAPVFGNTRDNNYWTILGRLDQFLIGMIAATVALRVTLASRLLRWALPVGLVGMAMALYLFNLGGGWPNEAGWRVFWPTCEAALWALVVLGYLAVLHGRHGPVSKVIAAVGTISYSMYLLHLTVLDILVSNGLVLHAPRMPLLAALFTGLFCLFPLVVLVSTLTYHAIEKPFLDLRRRYLDPESGTQPALDAPVVVTGGEAAAWTPTGRGLIACYLGVAVFLLAGLFFAAHLRRESSGSVADRAMRQNIARALTVSRGLHPASTKMLFASDEYASIATEVGLQLARAGEPFVVAGGRWKNSFGAEHQWRILDAKALQTGLAAWYILPRSLLLWGLIKDHQHFSLRDGTSLVLTSPTLELSGAGHMIELAFTPSGHVQDFALGGWASSDPGGTWSAEGSAAMAFHPRVIVGSGIEISVDAHPFVAPAQGLIRQRLRLLFNGKPIDPEQQFTMEETAHFTIPAQTWNAEAAKVDAQVSLVFEFPDAVVPASLAPGLVSDDTRALGLFFTRMQLKVVP